VASGAAKSPMHPKLLKLTRLTAEHVLFCRLMPPFSHAHETATQRAHSMRHLAS